MAKKNNMGITARKEENFSDWYVQVIQKAELADYTEVSGCMVVRPRAWAIWENVQEFFNEKIKASGVKNAAFPLLIPEHFFTRESEHVEGFTPEVAWVTQSGNSKLPERLAVRPTSETIMYDSYAKWIRSYNDLPLRLNQWCSVVRWEFKHPVPFLRTREFWWQEGHTVFETKEEADAEVLEILEYYRQVFEDLFAVPSILGQKSDKEKFAGALYTTSIETFLPNGKAIQACTSHALGQNFAKAFNIKFLGRDEKEHLPWQNSWGLTTRSIGIMIMMHSDNKGLVLPPNVAPEQIVIVPIVFEETKDAILKKANELKKQLEKKYSVILDDRDNYRPGWKFNEWELKGVPLRIELGPKDMEKGQVTISLRDNAEKKSVDFKDLQQAVKHELKTMQKRLFKNAKNFIKKNTVTVKSWNKFKEAVNNKQLIKAPWCNKTACEEEIKDATGGVKVLNKPFKQPTLTLDTKCVHCREKAETYALFAKSY